MLNASAEKRNTNFEGVSEIADLALMAVCQVIYNVPLLRAFFKDALKGSCI